MDTSNISFTNISNSIYSEKQRPKLIGLSGRKGSGKDTVADMLLDIEHYKKLSFAGPIKAMLGVLLGVGIEKFEDHQYKETIIPELGVTPRQMMQTLGTEWGRQLVHPDLWTMVLGDRIKAFQKIKANIVIADVRFDNEAERIKSLGGMICKIERPSLPPPEDTHRSESGISPELIDYTLTNDYSKDYLYKQVLQLHKFAQTYKILLDRKTTV